MNNTTLQLQTTTIPSKNYIQYMNNFFIMTIFAMHHENSAAYKPSPNHSTDSGSSPNALPNPYTKEGASQSSESATTPTQPEWPQSRIRE
mmetsp:Transcript_10922/g.22866  ORF Transcript_10922/g.22866 Transcript_10922/m.22866 type:complete len:90 (-) Transcript_10922:353-622(-)